MALGTSLLPLLPASAGATKFVATSGSDTTGDGSLGNPWASLQKLLDTLTPGQVGQMAAGIYNAPTGVRHTLNARSGTAIDPIEVRAAPGAVVQIRPNLATPNEAMLVTGASSYWRFRNLFIENAGPGSNHPNMWLSNTGGGCHHVEWWNCTFRNAVAGSGTFCEHLCHHVYYINCKAYGNVPTLLSPQQSQGFYVTGDDCMILNCIASAQLGYGFQIRTNGADGPNRVIVANNLAYFFKDVNVTPPAGTEYSGFAMESTADDCQVWNNISYDNRFGMRGLSAGVTPVTPNILRKNISNANDNGQYANNNATFWVFDFDGAGNHVGPGDNLTSDPRLADPANGDFTLQAGSPAIGYGNDVFCPTFDHNGTVRSQCDAGPFAFVAPGAPASHGETDTAATLAAAGMFS